MLGNGSLYLASGLSLAAGSRTREAVEVAEVRPRGRGNPRIVKKEAKEEAKGTKRKKKEKLKRVKRPAGDRRRAPSPSGWFAGSALCSEK